MIVLEQYIRALLAEDPMGFVHDLAASEKFGKNFFGGQIPKEAGRDIKRAFAKNADYQFLDALNTVHWTTTYSLAKLKGKGKDELSATMTYRGKEFTPAAGLEVGLWIKGRITLAVNDQDTMYSGFWGDYDSPHEGSEEAVTHRDKSSGRNKRPSMSKDYSRYGQLERGNDYHEEMARNIPYVLDQTTWQDPESGSWGKVNEALVDNWSPVGIVVGTANNNIEAVLSHSDVSPNEIELYTAGTIKQIFLLAKDLGVPIFDLNQTELWSPKLGVTKEAKVDKMKITKRQLRSIIKEEKARLLGENFFGGRDPVEALPHLKKALSILARNTDNAEAMDAVITAIEALEQQGTAE
tara:strand:- start:718 stop:1773 length:1056 start_codon:yes stop_codon:yes gene_type:complete